MKKTSKLDALHFYSVMVRSPNGGMVEKRVGPSGRGGQSAERRFGSMRAGWERTESATRGSPARFAGEDHECNCGSITSSTGSGNREPSFSSSVTSSGSSTAAAIVAVALASCISLDIVCHLA